MFKKKSIRINTYLGYGTNTIFCATGRALEDENIVFGTNQHLFRTLKNMYKQLESDEIRNTSIFVTLPNNQIIETTTDHEGYYHIKLDVASLSKFKDNEGWIPYTVSFNKEEHKVSINKQNQFESQMLIPTDDTKIAVISDIDDTILHTGVASFFKWRVVINTIFKNYDKRAATKGTVSFYQKLHAGTQKSLSNPFFYVSNSPWNLYDYLSAFLKKNNFPKGPVLLRDFRTPFDKTLKPKIPHKRSEIINLLQIYPNLNYILIGDSGEKDIDYYTKIALEYPNRILAIYIRNVNHLGKEKRMKQIINNFSECPILLIKNSEEAVRHAKEMGYIY